MGRTRYSWLKGMHYFREDQRDFTEYEIESYLCDLEILEDDEFYSAVARCFQSAEDKIIPTSEEIILNAHHHDRVAKDILLILQKSPHLYQVH